MGLPLFLFNREDTGGVKDRVFGHFLVGVKPHSLDNTLLPYDMDGGVGKDAMRFLVPFQLRRFKLLPFPIQGVHVAPQCPLLLGLVIIGVVGFERSLHRQVLVKLLQINARREFLVRRFGPVVH